MAWRSRLSKAAKNINKRERSESAAPDYKKIYEYTPESPIVEECLNENGHTENIQIHREALEKASGIFQQVLEDSPMTRELLKQSELQLENISIALKRIVKLSKQYQAAANIFRETATQFGQELLNFDYSDIPSVIGDQLKDNAKILGGSIISVMDYQTRLINQFATGFTQPMENYIKTEIKDAKETCKQQARLRIKYDAALSKYSHIKKTEVEKIPEAEHELFYIRKEFQQASLDYSSKLHKTETISKIQLLERSCSILNSEKDFVSNGFFSLPLFSLLPSLPIPISTLPLPIPTLPLPFLRSIVFLCSFTLPSLLLSLPSLPFYFFNTLASFLLICSSISIYSPFCQE